MTSNSKPSATPAPSPELYGNGCVLPSESTGSIVTRIPSQSASKYVALKRNRQSSQSERKPISVFATTSAGNTHRACVALMRVQPGGSTELGPIVVNGSTADVKPSAYVTYAMMSGLNW